MFYESLISIIELVNYQSFLGASNNTRNYWSLTIQDNQPVQLHVIWKLESIGV